MKLKGSLRDPGGYVIQEIIVSVVIFGIAMVPFVRALKMVPAAASAVAWQARTEAWRSANDQAVGLGIDPANTRVLGNIADGDAMTYLQGGIARADTGVRAGAPRISLISEAFSETAEARGIALGLEVGRATVALPPREDPLPPLPPIVLSPPIISPANGSFIPILSLLDSGVPGMPFQANILARGASDSDRVQLRQSQPRVQNGAGVPIAAMVVDAIELAQSVRGSAWSEYPGDDRVDIPVTMDDGRTRWIVSRGDRRQAYEPSARIDFVFGVDLGRPIFRLAGLEHSSGETVSVDFAVAHSVETGTERADIAFPRVVSDRFGNGWSGIAPSFDWSFGPNPGNASNGNVAQFFGASGRSLWQDQQTLSAATESGLAGLRGLSASWNVQRQTTQLQAPDRVAAFYDGLIDEPGLLDFSAPIFPSTGSRLGRPEISGVESVGDTVSVLVFP